MAKAESIYRNMKNQAKETSDKANTVLYVSDTVSDYIRTRLIAMIQKEAAYLISDADLGVIGKDEFDEESAILKMMYKSLTYK